MLGIEARLIPFQVCIETPILRTIIVARRMRTVSNQDMVPATTGPKGEQAEVGEEAAVPVAEEALADQVGLEAAGVEEAHVDPRAETVWAADAVDVAGTDGMGSTSSRTGTCRTTGPNTRSTSSLYPSPP
jgi:hypothetical protein